MKALTLFAWCVLLASNAIAQKDGEPMVLEIVGRITDGEKKLVGCQVTVAIMGHNDFAVRYR